MLRLLTLFRGSTSPQPTRARLRLEALECRDQPSSLVDENEGALAAMSYQVAIQNVAPQIVDFTAEEAGNGLFLFTGRVIDEAPGGLTVTFGGACPSVDGKTTATDENGNFSLLVRLATDGSEGGTVTAVTTDAQGATSNTAEVHVSPTPP